MFLSEGARRALLASHWTLKRVGGVCFVVVVVPRVVVSVVVVPRAAVVFVVTRAAVFVAVVSRDVVVPRAVVVFAVPRVVFVVVVARDQLRAAHSSVDAMDHAV